MVRKGKEENNIVILNQTFFRVILGVALLFFFSGNLIALSYYFAPAAADKFFTNILATSDTGSKVSSFEQLANSTGYQAGITELPAAGAPPSAPDQIFSDGKILTLGSFGFSNYNIDATSTNLYYDNLTTAVMFPLDYTWHAVSTPPDPAIENYFNTIHFNNFTGPYSDSRCIEEDCLNQTDNNLDFNGLALNVPTEIQGADIRAVSIAALDKVWLVGYTIKDTLNFRGEIFYFDGQNFTRIITPDAIISSYFGLFGFGGTENDFLIIYGAYDGIAYHVLSGNITNISKFFSMRLMADGFKAEVIRTAYQDNINWYIFSSTLGRPHLIKLWQNRGPEIVGVTAYEKLIDNGVDSVALLAVTAEVDKTTLIARSHSRNGNVFSTFIDRGFNSADAGLLTTIPLTHDGLGSKISIKKIAKSVLDLDSASRPFVGLLFSVDGANWQDVPLGENLDFFAPDTTTYFLKIIFLPFQDKFYSPFLDSVSFDYYAEKV